MNCQINALSIDLEDWYHPEIIRKRVISLQKSLIQKPTELLLGLLNKYNCKATFFIVGEVASRNPELIRKIYADGHEIAAHGLSHKTLHEIGPDGLKKELTEFKEIITGILGNIEIKGFRAPSFSLNQNTSWAINILKGFKFRYDSSIFPIKLGLYGVNNGPLHVYGINGDNIRFADANGSLKEFPITVLAICKFRFPISGGLYLRTIPICLQQKALKLINKERPFIIYIHPWECDINTPQIDMNALYKFISYYNIKSTLNRLEILLNSFNFDRLDNILGV